MKLAAVLVCISSVAFADARYKRAQVPVEASRSERTAPIRAEPPKQAPRPLGANAALAREIRFVPTRDDQARILEMLAAQTPDGTPDKADVLFRLAELYAKQARAMHLEAVDAQLRR